MYGSTPLGLDHSESGNGLPIQTIAVAVCVGLSVVFLGSALPEQAYAKVVSRPIPKAQTYVNTPGSLARMNALSNPQQAGSVASSSVLASSSQGSLFAPVGAFFAGCAVAVAALALRFTSKPQAADFTSLAVGVVTEDLTGEEIPEVLGDNPDPNSIERRMEAMLRAGQLKICQAIEESDGKAKFRADAWKSPGRGGGISRVLADGKVWEKAGINLSVLRGQMPQEALYAATEKAGDYLKRMNLKPGEPVPFFVASLSCVMHPRNPHCPTMHFNYRYFELDADNWWFAGGTDITPVYLDEEDMKHFHGTYKKVCDKYDKDFYRTFKKWADEYFLIKHRGETRGLGGIFFDDLNDRDKDTLFKFAEECLNTVVPAYVPAQ
eukprot:EG_transcript_5546